MKIVFDKAIPELDEGIRTLFPDAEAVALEGKAIKLEDVADADALIVRTRTRCDASLLEGSRVSLVGTATIGTDHIDLDWCRVNGITTVSAPGCNAPAVMQYVASSLAKAGFDPTNHRIGVVGKGNIGSLVAELYRGAGTEVLVCDPPRKDAGHTDEEYLTLEELTEKCDAITFHVPYTESGPYPTHHLLSQPLPENLRMIVNASRGPVIDHALLSEKAPGRRYIIDTWPFEEFPTEFDAEARKKLIDSAFIATPHIAGYSIEGKRRATHAMLEALKSHFKARLSAEAGANEHTYAKGVEMPEERIYGLKETIASFDPMPLSISLKKSPDNFEKIRGAHLRPEPKPLTHIRQ